MAKFTCRKCSEEMDLEDAGSHKKACKGGKPLEWLEGRFVVSGREKLPEKLKEGLEKFW